MPPSKGKKPAAQTAKRNAAPPKKSAQYPKPSKRSSASQDPVEVPIWERNVTSKAARERKRVKITRASIYQNEDGIEKITAMAEKLQGESRYSWGTPHDQPLEASKTKKRRSRPAKMSTEDAYMQMFEAMGPKPRVIVPNCPARSAILRMPLEIREEIYSYLLLYPEPILVKHGWAAVESKPFRSHAIIEVCKQFAEEASNFLYKFNVFKALLRIPKPIQPRNPDEKETDPNFLSLFRNIIIDCQHECWNLEWYEKATTSLQAFVDAKAVIQSLTLALVPNRVGMSETALGMESNPITFADFLWYEGPLMNAIRNLGPKSLNVVVKLKKNKKFTMTVDMKYLKVDTEETLLANMETLRLAQVKAGMVKEELLGLKDRFEEAFEEAIEEEAWAAKEDMSPLPDDEDDG